MAEFLRCSFRQYLPLLYSPSLFYTLYLDYLETAKDVGATMPSLMFIAEHWQDVAKPFVEAQLPGYDTYVMGGHLMFYEYPEKWNRVLEDFLNKL